DGRVTAGNSSPLNDGAFAALVGTWAAADRLGVAPLGEVLVSAVAAVEPQRFTSAPVGAVRKLLARLGIGFGDVALWEINEAFAAMVLSVLHELPEVDPGLVNVHGGALAYGHPLGASMPRVIVDVARHLRARGGGIGIATACIGVGQGMAVAVRGGGPGLECEADPGVCGQAWNAGQASSERRGCERRGSPVFALNRVREQATPVQT